MRNRQKLSCRACSISPTYARFCIDGLIAEEVEQISPDLVTRNGDGQVISVRYEAVNAMLLNEFLKEHRKNEEQAATIDRLEQQVETLAAGLHKVSAQLAAASPSLADLN